MSATTPTKVVAGITVPDTALITTALTYLQSHTPPVLYNHCVRSWLFGSHIASQVPALQPIDPEAHAIAVLFHDIGLCVTEAPDLISTDKRFEVDGANAARAFLAREAPEAKWDRHRVQLVWDTIALHSTVSIALHKEIEVQAAVAGIFTDLSGPVGEFGALVGQARWEAVVAEYPRLDMRKAATEMLCNMCKRKPETTYDNFLRDFGDRYVEGYSA